MIKPEIAAAGAAFVGALGMAFPVAEVARGFIDDDQAKFLREAKQELVLATGEADEAQLNLSRVEQSLGEACLPHIRLYMPGGRLEYEAITPQYEEPKRTGEDAIVDDLLRIPGEPCGDNPPDIRLNYRQLREVEVANNREQKDLTEATGHVENEEEDLEYANGRLAAKIVAGAGGTVVGAIVSFVSFWTVANKREAEERG